MSRVIAATVTQTTKHRDPVEICRAIVRLSKPGIVAAITLSGLAGMVLTGHRLPERGIISAGLAALFLGAAGSALMNCILEHGLDTWMGRTASRRCALTIAGIPLVLCFSLGLILVSLALSAAFFGERSTTLLAASVFGYTIYYTLLLKRRTHWASVLGGIPGALPVLFGGSTVSSSCDPGTLVLFLVLLLWQPPHFWLLALSYQDDYRLARIPVLPVVKGVPLTRWCTLSLVLLMTPTPLMLFSLRYCSLWYALFSLCLGLTFLFCCHKAPHTATGYLPAFRFSVIYLLALLLATILDVCLR